MYPPEGKGCLGYYMAGSIAFWLDLSRVPQEGTPDWYYKPGQESVAGNILGPRREPTTVVFLHEHVAKLLAKYLCLCP